MQRPPGALSDLRTMPTCQIELHSPARCGVTLNLSDQNRLRWTVAAVRSHAQLRDSLAQHAQASAAHITDNIHLMERGNALSAHDAPEGVHVVLWDGYNSLLELQARQPTIAARTDIVYLCIGMVPEVVAVLPAGTMPLYDPEPASAADMASNQHARMPAGYDFHRQLRTRLRMLRNWQISHDRHRQLSQGGMVVFCGLIRPSESVLQGFLRGTQINPGWVQSSGLVNMAWQGQVHTVKATLLSACTQLMNELRALSSPTPADWAAVYSLMNVMHRLGTLCQIHAQSKRLFVNEYAQQQHFDPYDAAGYRHNLFVDFGSVRGPDALYPRRVDMELNGKPSLSLRWLHVGHTVADCLQEDSTDWLWQRCSADAALSLAKLESLR